MVWLLGGKKRARVEEKTDVCWDKYTPRNIFTEDHIKWAIDIHGPQVLAICDEIIGSLRQQIHSMQFSYTIHNPIAVKDSDNGKAFTISVNVVSPSGRPIFVPSHKTILDCVKQICGGSIEILDYTTDFKLDNDVKVKEQVSAVTQTFNFNLSVK
jgi:hypothetical protein